MAVPRPPRPPLCPRFALIRDLHGADYQMAHHRMLLALATLEQLGKLRDA